MYQRSTSLLCPGVRHAERRGWRAEASYESLASWRAGAKKSLPRGPVPPLVVRSQGSDLSLAAGASYLAGRDPQCDLVISDARVSWHHAVLRHQDGRWVLADNGSTNGTYAGNRRVDRIEISGESLVRFADPVDGPVLSCTVGEAVPSGDAEGDGTLEIPYAVRWLMPKGERFANFDILNDNDTQLDYYRRFGHVYAVGIPTKKWRLVVVSDPELLDEVAADEEQFGKRVEEINFFAQLSNSRGGGISVIGDGEHYEQIRRVMLPWYAPSHQRTQLERMKDQARKLVAAWSAIPDDEPLDARAWMERYTLEVSGRGACAYDFGLLEGNGDPHPFAAAVPASTKESILRVAEPRPDFTAFAGRARRARRKLYRRHNEELFKTADALVRARMHTCPLGQQTDLLSRLVSTPDPETGELLDAETDPRPDPHAPLERIQRTVDHGRVARLCPGHAPGHRGEADRRDRRDHRRRPRLRPAIRRPDGTDVHDAGDQGDDAGLPADAGHDPPQPQGRNTRPLSHPPGRHHPGRDARRAARPALLGPGSRPVRSGTVRDGEGRQPAAPRLHPVLDRETAVHGARGHVHDAPRRAIRDLPTLPAAARAGRDGGEEHGRDDEAGRGSHHPSAARAGPVPAGPAVVRPEAHAPAVVRLRGEPTEIPGGSAYRHLSIAYGSNFGANKELAERFAERSDFHGYTSDVMTLNELAASPPRTQPWLLVVMTSTYTSNPPSNATAFKSWLEHTKPGDETWRNCRYLVWGLGNSQWNAFLAFPRYVHQKLSELGATPLTEFAYGDVGSPVWERLHADWNTRVWPILLELSGARPTEAAAERVAAEKAATGVLTSTDSSTAMRRSLYDDDVATQPIARSMSVPSIVGVGRAQSRVLLVPTILTNAVGKDTVEARVLGCRELQAAGSPKRTRHLDVSLPPGVAYRAGDHLGVCPKNDEERVERLARHLGAELDSLFMAPKTMNIRAVPKGVVIQVRNVLTNLIDITGRPTVPLLDLLLEKATDSAERSRLVEIRDVLQTPDGLGSRLRAAIDAGGYDVLRLLDKFPSCALNIFEFLRVAQPLRPRYYSTSSSPRIHGDDVAHLTVGLEATPVHDLSGRDFRGMSSRYMHAMRDGDRLNIFLDSADGFRLQDDVTKPMIFVSAGTGFAPMRAFLWERLALKHSGVSLAEAALFNGIRSSSLDYIYRDEIGRFAAEGVLNHVHVATSRERPGRQDYVQDRIRAQGALVWRLLAADGSAYICGSQPMRGAVRAAFVDVVTEHGSMPREQAEAYLHELETTARYRPDLWG